ncbi:MAG: Spo0E like sporulation regulatory protein [Eubacterium sp.]|jgi:hypothetical protein|nr:Spo0E like sporulation regulatory protein [Eubacterium sp.]
MMMTIEMENLREKLNKLVEANDCDSIEVLELSRKMDILIFNYMEQEFRQTTVTSIDE